MLDSAASTHPVRPFAKACCLPFSEKFLVIHHWLSVVGFSHVIEVVLVTGQTHHQVGSLNKIVVDGFKFLEHVDSRNVG